MEKSQYELVMKVLKKLQDEGVLQEIVVAGSWSVYFYRYYFEVKTYISAIRTLDIDFLVPVPYRPKKSANVIKLLKELNFEHEFVGRQGLIKLRNPELTVEFLVPEKGKGSEGPYKLPQLGINAQPLRYLSMLLDRLIIVEADGIKITVPHPASYALHKFIIFKLRKKSDKAERDFETAKRVFMQLVEAGKEPEIRAVFKELHPKWQKTIITNLEKVGQNEIAGLLGATDK